jgi:hypothetical protein
MLALDRAANGWSSKLEKGNAMTVPMNDTLNAIGRQLSVAYLPTVREPLPRGLKNLVAQLVALEMRKRGASARSAEALQAVMAQLAPDSRSTDPSIKTPPHQRKQT